MKKENIFLTDAEIQHIIAQANTSQGPSDWRYVAIDLAAIAQHEKIRRVFEKALPHLPIMRDDILAVMDSMDRRISPPLDKP